MPRWRQKRKPKRSIISLVACLFLLYFLIFPLICYIFLGKADAANNISNVVSLIPFGNAWYACAINIFAELTNTSLEVLSLPPITVTYALGELAKSIFTAIIFELLYMLLSHIMGFEEYRGVNNYVMRICTSLMLALLAACIAPSVMEHLVGLFHLFGSGMSDVITFFIIVLQLGGMIAFLLIFKGLSILNSALFVLIKLVLVDLLRLVICYISFFMLYIAITQKMYLLLAPTFCDFVGIGILLLGIELMLQSVLPSD